MEGHEDMRLLTHMEEVSGTLCLCLGLTREGAA